jgi:hypothetical protein
MFAELYSPSDVDLAHREHKATCGPCSFAALVGEQVMAIMQLFPQFPERSFTNLVSMKSAFRRYGLSWERSTKMPTVGIVLISGPRRYYSRHWIAVKSNCVYEVGLQLWVPRRIWERDYLSALAASERTRASEWYVEYAFETYGVVQPQSLFKRQGSSTGAAASIDGEDGSHKPSNSRTRARLGDRLAGCAF